jgi:hypothetical protein
MRATVMCGAGDGRIETSARLPIDSDSFIGELHGEGKQGARLGYTAPTRCRRPGRRPAGARAGSPKRAAAAGWRQVGRGDRLVGLVEPSPERHPGPRRGPGSKQARMGAGFDPPRPAHGPRLTRALLGAHAPCAAPRGGRPGLACRAVALGRSAHRFLAYWVPLRAPPPPTARPSRSRPNQAAAVPRKRLSCSPGERSARSSS